MRKLKELGLLADEPDTGEIPLHLFKNLIINMSVGFMCDSPFTHSTPEVFHALRTAAEAFTEELFALARLAANHACRTTVKKCDIYLVRQGEKCIGEYVNEVTKTVSLP